MHLAPLARHGPLLSAGDTISLDRDDSIVTLTLNRPETLNAMNEAMMGEISAGRSSSA
jgi:enoyl-CoA hydratase/carnithine racemase